MVIFCIPVGVLTVFVATECKPCPSEKKYRSYEVRNPLTFDS
jgi:hypothetical protein